MAAWLLVGGLVSVLMTARANARRVEAAPHTFTGGAQALAEPLNERLAIFRDGGPAAADFLERAAFDLKLNMRSRWRAITTMGRLAMPRFKRPLRRALTSPEWYMRNAALIALLNAERQEAITGSIERLRDPALVVRTQAVRNLIALDARESKGHLWRELYAAQNFSGGQSLWIRAHIGEALARFAEPSETHAFQILLRERDPRLHRWAVEGLEQSGGVRLTDRREEPEVRRRKWLARLDGQAI